MSIDDKVSRDPRITVLAGLLGWSRRETLGCLVGDVWPIAYDQETHLISERVIDAAAGVCGFTEKLIEAELATRDRSGKVRVGGAKERIEYLSHKRDAGREGGLKSAEVRRGRSKQTSSTTGSTPQARGNPPVPDPVPASAPVPDPVQREDSDTPAAVGPLDLFKSKVDATAPAHNARHAHPRKPKPSEPTPDERAAAMRVLEKLSARNGIAYSGAAEHVRLIVAQLRSGVPEMDLRYVIGYCADELGWQDDADQAKYLRPETLFGPKTIAKYLDPARTWVAKNHLAPKREAS